MVPAGDGNLGIEFSGLGNRLKYRSLGVSAMTGPRTPRELADRMRAGRGGAGRDDG